MSDLVLILDDSELIVQMLEMVCQQAGWRTTTAASFAQVQDAIAGEAPLVIVSDLNLPDLPQGGDPVAALRTLDPLAEIPIILVSGIPQGELEDAAKARGAQGAISKDLGLPGMMQRLPELLTSLTP